MNVKLNIMKNLSIGIYPCDPEDVEQLGILFCLMNKDNLPSNEEENESVKYDIFNIFLCGIETV